MIAHRPGAMPAPMPTPIVVPTRAAVNLFHAVKAQILKNCSVMH